MTITCPQCKHQNPDDAEFCENCGAQLPVPAPVGSAPNPAGYPSTGSTLGAVPPGYAATGSGPLNQMVCPTCRAPLAAGDEFCFNCGTDVRNLTQTGQPSGAPNGGADPMAATIISAPQPQQQGMKDDDIDRALAALDNGSAGPSNAPTAVGPISIPPASPSGPVPPPNNAQTSPAPISTSVVSTGAAPNGPQGGAAGNAFAAPVPTTATQPGPVARQTGPVSGGAGSANLTLQISGPYGDEKVDWRGTEILLGRNDAKTRVFPEVNLDDNAASRRHLSVWKDDADSLFYAQDLESANGTLLNGRDLTPGEPTLLNNGDILKIGTRYSIKVQIS